MGAVGDSDRSQETPRGPVPINSRPSQQQGQQAHCCSPRQLARCHSGGAVEGCAMQSCFTGQQAAARLENGFAYLEGTQGSLAGLPGGKEGSEGQ